MAKGYQSYRGRRSAGTRALIALLVLILVAACGFMFAQRYIAYTDDGGMYLDTPFGRFDLPAPSAPAEPEPDAVEPPPPQEPDVNLVKDPAPEPEEPEEPEDLYGERHLAAVSSLPADAAALEAILTGAGANGFLWQARAPGGQLNYTSALAPAGSVAAGARDAASLQALCAGEDVVAAARFACFHDNVYAFDKANMQPAGICQRNGYIWYDNHNGHWLDPEKKQARAYVISLAVECAQLGFDELVLEEMHYPKTGRLQKIDYSGSQMAKPDALALFLTELREALEPYGTRISLLLSQELLAAGKDEASGEDLAALLPLVDAVYVATGDIPGTQALLTAIAGEEAPALVPLTAAPTAGNWCVSAG